MKRFEYKRDAKRFKGTNDDTELNYLQEMGENRWELVHVIIIEYDLGYNMYYWKRTIEEN